MILGSFEMHGPPQVVPMHGYRYNAGRKIWTPTLHVSCTLGITHRFTQTPAIH